jgi:hypothetical protein
LVPAGGTDSSASSGLDCSSIFFATLWPPVRHCNAPIVGEAAVAASHLRLNFHTSAPEMGVFTGISGGETSGLHE